MSVSLKMIRLEIGSQWSCFRMGVIEQDFLDSVLMRAAVFWGIIQKVCRFKLKHTVSGVNQRGIDLQVEALPNSSLAMYPWAPRSCSRKNLVTCVVLCGAPAPILIEKTRRGKNSAQPQPCNHHFTNCPCHFLIWQNTKDTLYTAPRCIGMQILFVNKKGWKFKARIAYLNFQWLKLRNKKLGNQLISWEVALLLLLILLFTYFW